MPIISKKRVKKEKMISPEVQIMMLGARRAGKTSMLASMYNSFSGVAAGTNLVMSKKGGLAIDRALDHMKALFREQHMVNDIVPGISDFEQSQGFDTIDFLLTIAGKSTVRPKMVRFVDCSGEWINNRDNEDKIGEEIEKSDVVIIAIDTVLLMEENGRYNRLNAGQQVTEFIINNMNADEVLNSKKMVLFVPMKCEKYFHQNNNPDSIFHQKRMKAITERIQKEYEQLFNFLTNTDNRRFFTVGILPAITIDGVEFDEFTSDGSDLLTDAIQYRYCEPDRFNPKYCDRALIYSLLFVQKKIFEGYYAKAYKAKGKKKISAAIVEWLQDRRNIAKDMDYIQELNKVVEQLGSDDYPGFRMVQDPESLEMKAEIRKKG